MLERLNDYQPRRPEIDGLSYHEGLNAVGHPRRGRRQRGAGRVRGQVNHRFAPDRSEEEAEAFVREFFHGFEVAVTDSAPGALPGLDLPAARAFVEAVGGTVNPKFGWTDVARFSALGRPGRELRARRPQPGPPPGRARRRWNSRAAARLRSVAGLEDWHDGTNGMTRRPDHEGPKYKGPVIMRRGQIDGRPPTSACSTRAVPATGCTPTRGGCCASRRSSSRASAPWPSSARRSVFSGRRAPRPDSEDYATGEEVGRKLVQAGFAVITGGGPGAMEAANKGASQAGGVSVGLGIELPFETGLNDWVDIGINFRYFFARKTMFVKYAQGFIVLPGRARTFDELFEALTLVQTGRSPRSRSC